MTSCELHSVKKADVYIILSNVIIIIISIIIISNDNIINVEMLLFYGHIMAKLDQAVSKDNAAKQNIYSTNNIRTEVLWLQHHGQQ